MGNTPQRRDNSQTAELLTIQYEATLRAEANKYPELFEFFRSLDDEVQSKILQEIEAVSEQLRDPSLTLEQRFTYSQTFVEVLALMLKTDEGKTEEGEEQPISISGTERGRKVGARPLKESRRSKRFRPK